MRGPANRDTVQKNAYHAPAANTAAVVTLAASATERHVIDTIHCGYDAAPATYEALLIQVAGVTKWHMKILPDITLIGPHEIVFPRGFEGGINQEVKVSLGAGGVGRTGKVNVTYR